MQPCLAHRYASPAPMREIFVLNVIAPGFYAEPRCVLNRHTCSSLVPMLRGLFSTSLYVLRVAAHFLHPFGGKTPAGPDGPVTQVGTRDKFLDPAVAFAEPHARGSVFAENGESSVALPQAVNSYHVRGLNTNTAEVKAVNELGGALS